MHKSVIKTAWRVLQGLSIQPRLLFLHQPVPIFLLGPISSLQTNSLGGIVSNVLLKSMTDQVSASWTVTYLTQRAAWWAWLQFALVSFCSPFSFILAASYSFLQYQFELHAYLKSKSLDCSCLCHLFLLSYFYVPYSAVIQFFSLQLNAVGICREMPRKQLCGGCMFTASVTHIKFAQLTTANMFL